MVIFLLCVICLPHKRWQGLGIWEPISWGRIYLITTIFFLHCYTCNPGHQHNTHRRVSKSLQPREHLSFWRWWRGRCVQSVLIESHEIFLSIFWFLFGVFSRHQRRQIVQHILKDGWQVGNSSASCRAQSNLCLCLLLPLFCREQLGCWLREGASDIFKSNETHAYLLVSQRYTSIMPLDTLTGQYSIRNSDMSLSWDGMGFFVVFNDLVVCRFPGR